MSRKRLHPDHTLVHQINEYIEKTQKYNDGRFLRNLAAELDISQPALYNFLKEQGFPMRLGQVDVNQDIIVFVKE